MTPETSHTGHTGPADTVPTPPNAVGGVWAADEADALAALVEQVPGVVSLGGGGPLQPATYLPGRRVTGIRSSAERVEIAVVGRFGVPATELGDRIRAALGGRDLGRPVDVHVADIELPDSGVVPHPAN